MNAAARQYELIYIVSPDATEQQVADLHGQVESTIDRFGGRLDNTENWGRRRLAYVIQRQKEGTYVLELITGPGEMIRELDRRLRVADNVLRHLVVRVDEELRLAERAKARRKAGIQRRRAARGLPAEPEPTEPRPAHTVHDEPPQDEDEEGTEA